MSSLPAFPDSVVCPRPCEEDDADGFVIEFDWQEEVNFTGGSADAGLMCTTSTDRKLYG